MNSLSGVVSAITGFGSQSASGEETVDALVSELVSPKAPLPRVVLRSAFEAMLLSADLFSKTLTGDSQIGWQEFKNKLEAFYLFEHVDSVLNLSSDNDLQLQRLVGTVSRLKPYSSVWAMEGLGRLYTQSRLNQGVPPVRTLNSHQTKEIPAPCLLPLHTGMGLALAEWFLNVNKEKGEIETAGARFRDLCDRNSQPAYRGAVYEALGLVARNLHPQMVGPLDRELAHTNDDLLAYFWHGIGRGIYFLPSNFFPNRSAPWHGWKMCLVKPPHLLARRNVVAGFAWALTLVNICQPQVIACFLKHHGSEVSEEDAFINGVASALVVVLDSALNDAAVQALGDYNANQAFPSFQALWNRFIQQPGHSALAYYHSAKKKEIGELFKYGPLP